MHQRRLPIATFVEPDHHFELAGDLLIRKESRRRPRISHRVIGRGAKDLPACVNIDSARYAAPLTARHPFRDIRGRRFRYDGDAFPESDDALVVHRLRFVPAWAGRYVIRGYGHRVGVTEFRA